MKARIGLCVPSGCSNKDIKSLLKAVAKDVPFDVDVPVCTKKEKNVFSWDQILVLSALGLLGLVIFVGTFLDLYNPPMMHPATSYLRHFSLYTNGKRLLETEVKTQRLKALNGIKVLGMTWILLAHTYSHAIRFTMSRSLNLLTFVKEPVFTTIWNAFIAVDTFFTISGFLVCYLTLSYLDKTKGNLNIVGFYVRRFWRLMPSMLLVMAVFMLFPLMGSGPLFEEIVQREVDICRRNWWSVIFFVNSWLDYFDMCLVHTWFISNDIHFYILSPLFVVLLYKKPTFGVFVCIAMILLSVVILACTTAIFGLVVIVPFTLAEFHLFKDLLQLNYFKPYCHLSTYMIGVLLGFLFYRCPEIKLPKICVVLGWGLSTVFALCSLVSVYDWAQGNHPTVPVAALYQSLHRVSWGISMSWIIFACCYGYGGFVNTFLSWRGFVPLNRLVYMVYLTQMPIQWLRLGTMKHIVPLEHVEVIYEFFANIIVTVGISAVAYLVVEAPFASLDSELFGHVSARRLSKRLSKRLSVSVGAGVVPTVRDDSAMEGVTGEKDENMKPKFERQHSLAQDFPVKLTTSMVTTVSPESEPMTENETRAARLVELRKLYKEWKPASSYL